MGGYPKRSYQPNPHARWSPRRNYRLDVLSNLVFHVGQQPLTVGLVGEQPRLLQQREPLLNLRPLVLLKSET